MNWLIGALVAISVYALCLRARNHRLQKGERGALWGLLSDLYRPVEQEFRSLAKEHGFDVQQMTVPFDRTFREDRVFNREIWIGDGSRMVVAIGFVARMHPRRRCWITVRYPQLDSYATRVQEYSFSEQKEALAQARIELEMVKFVKL